MCVCAFVSESCTSHPQLEMGDMHGLTAWLGMVKATACASTHRGPDGTLGAHTKVVGTGSVLVSSSLPVSRSLCRAGT